MYKVLIIFVIIFNITNVLGYDWPVGEKDKQQIITTTFGEKRPSGTQIPQRFHEGVDIVPRDMTQSDNREVYAIIKTGIFSKKKWTRNFPLTEAEAFLRGKVDA